LPRARIAREALPEILRAEGFEVDVVPVYDTVAAASDRAVELREIVADVDVVMLTSSSTVEKLCEVLDDPPRRLAHCKLASIGPVTTATAIALGLEVAITAEISTAPGLVDAIERAFDS
jgi:uroporphyrinogen III methyltransferase/synthase